MTGFVVFAVVLSLAYMLYYAAIIATDLTAQKKKGQTGEEVIDIDADREETGESAARNVVEDPSGGGFSFVSPSPVQVETPPEIAEADDEPETESAEEQQEPEREEVQQDMDLEPETEPETEAEEESEDFPVYSFKDDKPEPEKKVPSVTEAFDPSLREPVYDVSKVYEPSASPEVQEHADMVNDSMEPITVKGVCLTSSGLLSALRSHSADKYNIDYTHVQSKF